MKTSFCLSAAGLCLSALVHFAAAAAEKDPTRVSRAMGDVLKAQLAEFRSISIPGIVCAVPTGGVALIASGEGVARVVRTGSRLTLNAGEIPFPVQVTGVDDSGVSVKAETLDSEWKIPVAFARRTAAGTNELACVEFDSLPLKAALRLLSDQSGRNFSATAAAAGTKVSVFLRDVSVDETVDELCKSHGLWYRRDPKSGIVRILTMDEFRENLTSFQQEESTETFTLLYPNVTEVASVIQGLYADRVHLSLGDEDILDSELSDMSRRFELFNAVSSSGSSSDLMGRFSSVNLNRNSLGYGRGRGGIYSSSRGGWIRNGQWMQEEREQEREVKPLSVTDAERLGERPASTNSASVAEALAPLRSQLPSIYVTVSRRSNILVVRTSDPRVMEEIRALVKRVDVPTPMVLLEVEVMELELDDGMETVFDYRVGDLLGDHRVTADSLTTAFLPGATPTITFSILSKHLDSFIKLKRERGKVKTLATPTLLTAHSEVSQLFIGEEIPITRNVTATTVVNKEGTTVVVPQTETSWEKVGVRLLITPNINADRTVTLRLVQENSEKNADGGRILVLNTQTGATMSEKVDTIKVRSVSGTFVAQDRSAIVAGGLITETERDRVSGVPLLMDLPWLGWFFRSTEKVKARTELVVYFKPHVLSTPAEARRVTARFTDSNVRNPHADDYRSGDGLAQEEADRETARVGQKNLKVLPETDTFYIK